MSVYTPLEPSQIQAFLQRYGLVLQQQIPILNGIENSNWFIHDSGGQRWVLTVFEALPKTAVQQLATLMHLLHRQGIRVAAPIPAQDGQVVQQLQHKPAQLAPCLSGQHPEQPSAGVCRQMGQALAQLHQALDSVHLQPVAGNTDTDWTGLAVSMRGQLGQADQHLLDRLLAALAAVQQGPALPTGLIHGDLFRDNCLFEGHQLTGILDFSEWGHGVRLFDLAISLNDFCSDWPAVTLNADKARAFLQGYASVQPLDAAARQALPVYLAAAAGRFWLSRLQARQRHQRLDSREHVLDKDPLEMRAMLHARLADAVVLQ